MEGEVLTLDIADEIEGKTFAYWSIGDKQYNVGDTVQIVNDMHIVAVYSDGVNNGANNSNAGNGDSSVILISIIVGAVVVALSVVATIVIVKKKKSK